MNQATYQLFDPLRPEEYAALEADIVARGVMVAVEIDEAGEILDGYNRVEIAERHGLSYPKITRKFSTEQEKRIHVRMLNLARRHLETWQWGKAFLGLLEDKGVKRGQDSSAAKRHDSESETVSDLAASLGVDDRTARNRMNQADAFDALPKREQAAIRTGEKTLVQAKRDLREKKREQRRKANAVKVEQTEDVTALKEVFATILIDPPWDWSDEGDVNQLGRAKPDYATMTIEQLHELPVGQLADSDCHLYCWVTNRSLPKVFALIEAWGFRYVTLLTWPKPSFGMGNYFRGQTEHVVFGVRGSQALKVKDSSTLLPVWPRGRQHSSKPLEFYEFVERCSPGPYLELFARQKRQGWSSWGSDA